MLVSCWFTAWPHYHHGISFFCFLFWALLVTLFWINTTGFGGTRCWQHSTFWSIQKNNSDIRISDSFFRFRPTDLTAVSVLQSLKVIESEENLFSLTQVQTFLQRGTASKVLMSADCVGLICDAGIHPSGMMTDPSACFILAINEESSFFK